ncbi:hypothetical protein [Streptomyces lydicus]|uniref:hypothetical protein n=1 Tax=Streptomyces lydicus TaxID=47763 RepID=UPI0037B89CA2
MQFTAEHAEWGKVDITLDDLGCSRSWEEIHRVRGVELRCPECGGQVFARLSKLGTRHLYHRTRPPSCSLANESLEHHLLKLELVTCARAAGYRAELEWWTTPSYVAADGKRAEEEEEARRQARTQARQRAVKEREKARKKKAKARAYDLFWERTGLDQQQWRYFRALAELYFSRSLVFGAPDSRYGDGRPVYERSGPEGEQWSLVGVACPDPCQLRDCAEELALLVHCHEYLEVLANRAWAPFQIYVLDPDIGAMYQERVLPSPIDL